MSEFTGLAKIMMMREALASCQIEGIGLDITLEDMLLYDFYISHGYYKGKDGKWHTHYKKKTKEHKPNTHKTS